MAYNSSTKDIHDKLLVLLKRFNQFCLENDIKYSVHGGTMLGAIREKGFIPWDDDVDVSFTREEYEKFKKIIPLLPQDMLFEHQTNRFPRIWMKVENDYIYLDIFIYDYISSNRFVQKIKILGLAFFLAFLKTNNTMYMGNLHAYYKGLRLLIIKLVYMFGKLFPQDRKVASADRFQQKFKGNKKLIHRSNDVYKGIVHILPEYVMSEYEMTVFEDIDVMISKYAHDIMRDNFGENYMVPSKDDNAEDNNTHIITRDIDKETIETIMKKEGKI